MNDELLLQLRQIFNLSMPEIELVEAPDTEMLDDFAEIENFKIEDGSAEEEEIEYLDDDEANTSKENVSSQLSDLFNERSLESGEESDNAEYYYKEVEIEDENVLVKEETVSELESTADDISNHFE